MYNKLETRMQLVQLYNYTVCLDQPKLIAQFIVT